MRRTAELRREPADAAKLARAETPDHDFSRYLYFAGGPRTAPCGAAYRRPESLTPDEFPAWAAGIVNSEVAEEAAFAFLNRSAALPALFDAWIADPNPLLRYAALQSAARSDLLTAAWIAPAVEAVRRAAVCAAESLSACRRSAFRIFGRPPDRAGGRRAAVCRRRPERGEPAGGTPRSQFSG
ncbi:MAG: DNA alkylation repair enzyme [Alistipes finegoldii]